MLYVKSPKTQKRDKALNVFVPLPWKRAHGPPFFCVFFDLVWHKLQEKPWFVELLLAKKSLFNAASLLNTKVLIQRSQKIEVCILKTF